MSFALSLLSFVFTPRFSQRLDGLVGRLVAHGGMRIDDVEQDGVGAHPPMRSGVHLRADHPGGVRPPERGIRHALARRGLRWQDGQADLCSGLGSNGCATRCQARTQTRAYLQPRRRASLDRPGRGGQGRWPDARHAGSAEALLAHSTKGRRQCGPVDHFLSRWERPLRPTR